MLIVNIFIYLAMTTLKVGDVVKVGAFRKKKQTLTNRVAKLEKEAKNVEFKTSGQTTTGVVTATPGFVLLNGLVRGDTSLQRDGDVIYVKSIQVSIDYVIDVTDGFTQLRVIIVQDKQANQVTPAFTDIFNVASMTSFRNLDNRSRFITHKNIIFSMSSAGEKGGHWDWYKRLNVKAQYDVSNAGTVADITTNAFYLILFSTTSIDPPTITHTTRLRFTDK